MEVSMDKCKKFILGTICFSKNLEKVGRLMHPNDYNWSIIGIARDYNIWIANTDIYNYTI